MPVMVELPLAQVEEIKPISSSRPQQAASIPIECGNVVFVEAVRVGFFVLKPVRKTFRSPVEVIEALARWYPESILPVSQKVTASHADGTGVKWVLREPLGPAIVFDEPYDRRPRQHPQVPGVVFI